MATVPAYSFIEINGHAILGFEGTYLPELTALFTEDDWRHEKESYGYLSTVAQMRDRLQLHGFTAARARADLDAAVRVWHAQHANPDADDLGIPMTDSAMLLNALRTYVNSTTKLVSYEEPPEVFGSLDFRIRLRLALDVAADATGPVRYNLDNLLADGLLTANNPITDHARDRRARSLATDAPLVILTEGSSDAQLISEAIEVTHPHLAAFMRFMDFGSGAEGGAASLAKLVRSFMGAGIANRVLAIADNDTAAWDALKSLKRDGVPDNYRVIHYPDLPLLTRYPTLGPQLADPVLMDVNGTAGSLEMYLGRDVLTVNGDLMPVQWTGYIEGLRAYQGAISAADKKCVHRAFRNKVNAARHNSAMRESQDWSGVHAIVAAILGAFDTGI